MFSQINPWVSLTLNIKWNVHGLVYTLLYHNMHVYMCKLDSNVKDIIAYIYAKYNSRVFLIMG